MINISDILLSAAMMTMAVSVSAKTVIYPAPEEVLHLKGDGVKVYLRLLPAIASMARCPANRDGIRHPTCPYVYMYIGEHVADVTFDICP